MKWNGLWVPSDPASALLVCLINRLNVKHLIWLSRRPRDFDIHYWCLRWASHLFMAFGTSDFLFCESKQRQHGNVEPLTCTRAHTGIHTKHLHLSETDAPLLQPRGSMEPFLLWESKSWLMFAETENDHSLAAMQIKKSTAAAAAAASWWVNIWAGFRILDESFARRMKMNLHLKCGQFWETQVVLLW